MQAAASVPICDSTKTRLARALRSFGLFVQLLVAIVETAMAALMVSGVASPASLLFLFFSLVLLATAVISLRSPEPRVLLVAQAAAAAAVVALLFAAGDVREHSGPSLTFHGSTYSLTLPLAALLFIALLLARLLRRQPDDAACHCS